MLHAGRNVKDNIGIMNKIGIMIDEQPSLADEELCDNECKYFC